MQKAVDLFLDMGSMGQGSTGGQGGSSSDYRAGLFEEEVREAIPSRYDQLIGGPSSGFESMHQWVHQEATHIPSLAELEAEAIQDELEDAGLGQLYRAPEDINTSGGLAEAMKKAKEAGRWLLVNIQAADEFQSLVLNRDIWSHETVKEIIRSCFVFWQRDRSSAQGSAFVSKYNLTQLPAICIVDPRTGRKAKQWQADKFKGPLSAADVLSDFMGENPYAAASPRMSSQSASFTASPRDSLDQEVIDVAPESPQKIVKVHEAPLSMPTEYLADPGAADEVKIAVRLSNGTKKQVSFKEGAPLSAVQQWVSATEQIPPSKFEVRQSHPPKPVEMNSGDSVGSANIKGALLVVALIAHEDL